MKHALLFLILSVSACAADLGRLADAIREVEATPRHAKVGRAGERSEYQITPAVWLQHSTLPLSTARANTPEAHAETRRVAIEHLRWLSAQIDNPTPYRLAAAWNGGIGAVKRSRLTRRTADYARRVVNVYENT